MSVEGFNFSCGGLAWCGQAIITGGNLSLGLFLRTVGPLLWFEVTIIELTLARRSDKCEIARTQARMETTKKRKKKQNYPLTFIN